MTEMVDSEQVSSQKMLLTMGGIGVICALLIVLTYEGTLPRVQHLKAEALEKAIFNVVPGTSETVAFALVDGKLEKDGPGEELIYAGYDQERKLVGVAIKGEGQGYADKIKVLYGYDPIQEQVIGFQVLETKETPGLGDKIGKEEDFLANFHALDVALNEDKSGLAHEVVTVKNGEKEEPWQIDGITGATISSRAVGAIINQSANRWTPIIQQHLDQLQNQLSDE
ncbi:RnfABCDGE type electron transport complex subunit G [Reichenbachiella ulvae]|uniref:Ion-translocating oxidoreductase complex subunit G n=1 Tax=Reichenbachiella ulvae TaxID=2980104 RepID=A0ABT3CUD5_9BACT|nr:RnfABCDGE type electron transport complex subunit G [Reichenbachiella ulvae]MCV9387288.1 RnfABCDGE type electron transport complex subunit G [Reichenbachiella ulvae]